MTLVTDFASLIENFCNSEFVEQQPGNKLVQHGIVLDHVTFEVLTPTCSLIEREQVLAELPLWARRQIERAAAAEDAKHADIRRRTGRRAA